MVSIVKKLFLSAALFMTASTYIPTPATPATEYESVSIVESESTEEPSVSSDQTLDMLLNPSTEDLFDQEYVLYHRVYFKNEGLLNQYLRLVGDDPKAGDQITLDIIEENSGMTAVATYSKLATHETRPIVHYIATNSPTKQEATELATDFYEMYPDLITQTQVYEVDSNRYDVLFVAQRDSDLAAFHYDGDTLKYTAPRPSFTYTRDIEVEDPFEENLSEVFTQIITPIDEKTERIDYLDYKDAERLAQAEEDDKIEVSWMWLSAIVILTITVYGFKDHIKEFLQHEET